MQRVYDEAQIKTISRSNAPLVVDRPWQTSYYNFAFNALYGQDGTVFGFIHTATDVTGEVRALQQLQHSEVRFRALIEEAPVATCLLVGRDLCIEVANGAMLRLCGQDSTVLGQPLSQVLPTRQKQPLLALLQRLFEANESYAVRSARVDWEIAKLPSTHYVDWTAKPLLNEDNTQTLS